MTDTNEVIERAARAIWNAYRLDASDECETLKTTEWEELEQICANAKEGSFLSKVRQIGIDEATAALLTLRPGDRLPNGLVVVPEDATRPMIDVLASALPDRSNETKFANLMAAQVIYRAMLSALEGE